MITKETININFANGLDTKTDPKQVDVGKFLSMRNSVFTTAKRLTKRNGNQEILQNSSSTYITTLNNNLTAIGDSIYPYNAANETTVTKGVYTPLELSVLSVIRNSSEQSQADGVVADNGLLCVVYTETNGQATSYKYAVINSTTGQNIVASTLIPPGTGTVTGSPKVFLLGNYFVIVFTNEISSTYHLQYISISSYNPSVVTTPQNIATSYVPSPSVAWDAVAASNVLYIAYNTTSGGQSIVVSNLTLSQAIAGGTPTTQFTFVGYQATIMSVCADTTVSNPNIYITFYYNGVGYTAAVPAYPSRSVSMIPIQTIFSSSLNVASAAQNGTCTIFYEVSNSYGYDNTIPTNYINSVSITPAGNPVSFHSIFSSGASTITASSATGLTSGMYIVDSTTPSNLLANTTFTISSTTLTLSQNTQGNSVTTPGDVMLAQAATLSSVTTVVRSVGLASKAFIINGVIYFLSAYESSAASGAGYQPTYFLIDGSTSTEASPVVVGKLAYENGGGYLPTGIPNVTVNSNTAQVVYLYKDLIETQAPSAIESIGMQAPAVYTQTGINLATFNFETQNIGTVEIANGLQLTGAMGWMYDGYLPVEENFLLWPDSVEATTTQSTTTPTGTVTSGSNVITSVSSLAGVGIGSGVTGTDIPSGQLVTGFTSNTITFGPGVASGNHTGTITIVGNILVAQKYYYQVIYDWTDNQGNEYRSAPSIPVLVTIASGNNGTNTIYVPTLRLTYKIATPIRIRIYRWSVANQVYYEVTSIIQPLLNNTTVDYVTFYDPLDDSSIIGNNIIYTTGSVAEDVNSPGSSIITLFDTRAWKVDAEDPNLLWFSKQVIENVPVEWSDLLTYYVAPNVGTTQNTGGVAAMAPMDDKLILFKERGNVISFINGSGPDNTGANSQYPPSPYSIVSPVSCNNQASVVLMPAGLMFQANENSGIWLLDRGLNVTYIGKDVEAFNASTVTSAVTVPGSTQVRFTIDTGETLVYDYFFNQWDTFERNAPTPSIVSACIYNGLHTYLDTTGAVYQESPGSYLDGSNPVLMQFETGPIYISGISGYQRAIELIITGSYESPTQMVVQIAFNFGAYTQQYIITPTNGTQVYGSDSIYGQTIPFGGPGSLMQWRIPLEMQQCQSFNISMQEIFDSTYGQVAGAGFTLSNINCQILVKSGKRPFSAAQTQG